MGRMIGNHFLLRDRMLKVWADHEKEITGSERVELEGFLEQMERKRIEAMDKSGTISQGKGGA